MKEETLKQNQQQQLKGKNQLQIYDEYVVREKERSKPPEKKQDIKPKREKRTVYKLAESSSSDSSSDDEEENVV